MTFSHLELGEVKGKALLVRVDLNCVHNREVRTPNPHSRDGGHHGACRDPLRQG